MYNLNFCIKICIDGQGKISQNGRTEKFTITHNTSPCQTSKWNYYYQYCALLTVGIPHLLLPPLHVGKVIDDGLG